jgi:hypothetical protein
VRAARRNGSGWVAGGSGRRVGEETVGGPTTGLDAAHTPPATADQASLRSGMGRESGHVPRRRTGPCRQRPGVQVTLMPGSLTVVAARVRPER